MTESFTLRYQTYNLRPLRSRNDGTFKSIETTPVPSTSWRVNLNCKYKISNSEISRDDSQSCTPHFCYLTQYEVINQLHEPEPFLRSRQVCSYSRISQYFMEHEGLLPCSQEPSTSPYPEPDQSSPYHSILSEIYFNIHPPTSWSP
jgi:hypothetical protein